MGRALVRDAGTFLFDEPLSNLDAKLRGKMRAELAEMRDTIDKNMVYVTHDQVEAMTLGDRIIVMSDGFIQQQGSPEELFKSPVNTFVAGFIGSPTMNFIDGELVDTNHGTAVKGDGFLLPVGAQATAELASVKDRSVTLGLRPSSFSTDLSSGPNMELKVVVAEYLGAQSVLVTRCGGADVLVETQSATPIANGTVQKFAVNTDEIMIFDKTSGLRL